MTAANAIIVIVVLIILGAAIAYIVKAKRAGEKCIGCPMSRQCSQKNNTGNSCNCGCNNDSKID